uniref:Uncharacterized protein n=1 Tax=Lactuca sativa TaxID=4236 RepID=A0A9R1VVA7_LACSA|nr:hypothetical protein LSAT_V11C400221960 [Lactuca sativa]
MVHVTSTLGNDEYAVNFAQYVSEHKVMKVYTEHGETRLFTYFLNSKPVTKVTLVSLDDILEDVQHIDDAHDDQLDEALVLPNPNDILVDVMPTPPNQTKIQGNEIFQVVSLSPEYNKRKVWRKDGRMASCSKKLCLDDIGENEQIAKDFIDVATNFDLRLYQQILQSNIDKEVLIFQNVDEVNEPWVNEVNEPYMDETNEPQVNDWNAPMMNEVNQLQMNDFWDFDFQTNTCVQDESEYEF